MGNPSVTIQVDAIIRATQDSINALKSQLNNLVPNSNNAKQLNKLIGTMTSNMMRLQNMGNMPLTSQADFKRITGYVNKIQEAEAIAKQIGQGINFGDIKLTKGQEAEFAKLEQQLQDVENTYNRTINQIKANTFTNDFQKNLQQGLGLKNVDRLLNQDLDKILETVELKREALANEMQEYANVLNSPNIQRATQQNNLLQKFMQQGAQAFQGTDVAKHINAVGVLKGPSGGLNGTQFYGKNDRMTAILNELGLNFDAPELQALMQGKVQDFIKNLQSYLQNLPQDQLNNLRLPSIGASLNLNQETTDKLQAAQTQLNALTQVLPALSSGLQQAGAAAVTFDEQTGKIVVDLERLRQQDTNLARSGFGFQSLNSQAEVFKNQLQQVNSEFLRVQRAQSNFNSMKMAITNFMGFYQVLNLTKRAVREAMNHIKELDTVMNGIAIVSPNLNTEDLWQQIDQYSKVAQQYGVTIKGAYEVSKIYYQAGYDSADVMTLMNETLKLSKISGLDYATTTNYMMTATRGFHMEVAEASTVVDVYSNLAQNTAVSQQELAEAMSRTASSMEGVGATFQETSAMIATMEAATRETAYSIGTALKSIASRYGELKKAPSEMVDEDGEFLDYNKVDTALKSVGISLKDSEGQFRNMTDVILELSDVWNTLDSTQQRYIGTQFARIA